MHMKRYGVETSGLTAAMQAGEASKQILGKDHLGITPQNLIAELQKRGYGSVGILPTRPFHNISRMSLPTRVYLGKTWYEDNAPQITDTQFSLTGEVKHPFNKQGKIRPIDYGMFLPPSAAKAVWEYMTQVYAKQNLLTLVSHSAEQADEWKKFYQHNPNISILLELSGKHNYNLDELVRWAEANNIGYALDTRHIREFLEMYGYHLTTKTIDTRTGQHTHYEASQNYSQTLNYFLYHSELVHLQGTRRGMSKWLFSDESSELVQTIQGADTPLQAILSAMSPNLIPDNVMIEHHYTLAGQVIDPSRALDRADEIKWYFEDLFA
jgi:hypothetical protein